MSELVRNGFGFRKEEVTFLPDEVWSGERGCWDLASGEKSEGSLVGLLTIG